jgi:23S rRNA (cytidine2498-2'-O)-methyltransferase
MADSPLFFWITCQVGAERAVKQELMAARPPWHPAYSRPGFVTFKSVDPLPAVAVSLPRGVFVRSSAWSLGKVAGSTAQELAALVWQTAGEGAFDRLHVWQRDTAPPGDHDFEPGMTPEARAAEQAILAATPLQRDARLLASTTRPGQRVLDCVLIGPNEWWLGWHLATHELHTCLPGGLDEQQLPYEAVSRAWLKMTEALAWAQFPIRPGDHWVELGCAPGGSCQVLLARGMHVTGIDPAEMHPAVLGHPRFTHLRKRGADVRRREFAPFRWLAADMNVAPRYTLDTVESIVAHPSVRLRGLLLTIKLSNWQLARHLPEYVERVRCWGYPHVHARQLQHNRQEVTMAALAK